MGKSRNKKKYAGGILTDLSKAFDCLNRDLLIGNLSEYGFCNNSLKLLYRYLSDKKQRTRVNNVYRQQGTLTTDVPHGSIIGPLFI